MSEQYAELSKDSNLGSIFRLRKDIQVAENKCKIVDFVVNALMANDAPELWAILKHPHLNLQGSTITMVQSQAKRFITQLDDLQHELSKFISDKKTTRADFDEKLVILGKFTGYRIAQDTTMVSEYIAICNQYNEYVAISNAQADKKNGRGQVR